MDILIDTCDEWLLDYYSWHRHPVSKTTYARTRVKGTLNTKVYLHHLIIGRPLYNLVVDHINGNGLDNRRCNLRIVNKSVNGMNRVCKTKIYTSNKTGYRGVCFNKAKGKFTAQVSVAGKSVHLGTFDTPQEASRAYTKSKEVACYLSG